MFHPASLLLAWVAAAVALQRLTLDGLALALVLVLPFVLALAPARAWRLVRRARWLLLSLAVLFVFGTPGEVVPQLPWATWEGVAFAAEHVLRLVLLLQLLALMLQRLEPDRLLAGLYLLLAPVAALGFDRSTAVVRLMLVLEYVQGDNGETHWRQWLEHPVEPEPSPLRLPAVPLRLADYGALGLLALAFCAAVLRA